MPRAGLAEPCPCLSPDSLGSPGTSRGIEGVARQVGAGVTSGAITSDLLQPEELQSTEIPGQHLPSRLFWAEDGLVVSAAALLMRSTKSLQRTSIQKRLMPYVSVLPLKSVPGLSVFIALTLDSVPRAHSRPLQHSSLPPGAALTRHSGRWGGLWGPRAPDGRHVPAPQPSYLDLPTLRLY